MPSTMNPSLSDPKNIVEAGEKIYNERYRAQFEAEQIGKFVAINVKNGHATLGATSEEALEEARKTNRDGLFHLIRVGSPGAFQVSHVSNASDNWSYR